MTEKEMNAKAREYKELKIMLQSLEDEINALQDEIKGAMGDREQVIAGEYKISWKPVTSNRVDTTALKKELPDIAARLTKTSTARRFLIN
jgi:predicted phage-related endonuclease